MLTRGAVTASAERVPALFPPLGCHGPLCQSRALPQQWVFDMMDGSRWEIPGASLGADGLLAPMGCAISAGAFPAWHVNADDNPQEKTTGEEPTCSSQAFQHVAGGLVACFCLFAHKTRGKK